MARPVESPFIDHEVLVARAEGERHPRADAVAAESPFLLELADGRLFEGLVPKVSQASLRSRLDEYFARAYAEYRIPAHMAPDGTWVAESKANARPQFRYARRDSDQAQREASLRVSHAVGRSLGAAHRPAIVTAVLGRAKPREIAAITQALIDEGELDAVRAANPGRSASFLVRALQAAFKIGIDCAGYVQLAFIFAYTGRDDDPEGLRIGLGLKGQRTHEALRGLPADHFAKVPVLGARTGDLFVLRPQADSGDGSWHTVIVVDRTVSGTVHTFDIHGSWGVDLYGETAGGVAHRRWRYDTASKDWWDVAPTDWEACGQRVKAGGRSCVNKTGPYDGHVPHGMYRAREK